MSRTYAQPKDSSTAFHISDAVAIALHDDRFYMRWEDGQLVDYRECRPIHFVLGYELGAVWARRKAVREAADAETLVQRQPKPKELTPAEVEAIIQAAADLPSTPEHEARALYPDWDEWKRQDAERDHAKFITRFRKAATARRRAAPAWKNMQ